MKKVARVQDQGGSSEHSCTSGIGSFRLKTFSCSIFDCNEVIGGGCPLM